MANRYVVGVYKTEEEAVSAIRRLLEMGYMKEEISVLAKNPERFSYMASQTDIQAESPKAVARGAGAGAAAGGMLGGLGGLLLSLGVFVIPGVGPFLAAGPIAATLGGAAAGGAVGGVVGALAGMGIDKEEARDYELALNRGELLLIVSSDTSRYDQTRDVFAYPEEEYYQRYGRVGLGGSLPGHGGIDPDESPLFPDDPRNENSRKFS